MSDLPLEAPGLTFGRAPTRPRLPHREPLRIALVNNMPDAALAATERQFRHLVSAGAGSRPVTLDIYMLPDMPRADVGRRYGATKARPIETLYREGADALIVTGCEPRAAHLSDEPYWPSFCRLVDWARDHTASTLWSCLAAHAAVLHLDGIERRRLPAKLTGIFPVTTVAEHPLAAGLPTRAPVPHSRYNTLVDDDLTRHGYTILTRSETIGVDAFVRNLPSLFVCLQGHPEYGADSLAREYRRDLERVRDGQSDRWPSMPDGYFEPRLAKALRALTEDAASSGTAVVEPMLRLLASVPMTATPWHAAAAALYRNWLDEVERRTAAMVRLRRTAGSRDASLALVARPL